MLQLRRPSRDLVPSFSAMCEAVTLIGDNPWTERGEDIALTNPEAYVDLMHERSQGRSIPDGWVTCDAFWIVEGEDVVGILNVRHELNERLQKVGGHVGYLTHPQKRIAVSLHLPYGAR